MWVGGSREKRGRVMRADMSERPEAESLWQGWSQSSGWRSLASFPTWVTPGVPPILTYGDLHLPLKAAGTLWIWVWVEIILKWIWLGLRVPCVQPQRTEVKIESVFAILWGGGDSCLMDVLCRLAIGGRVGLYFKRPSRVLAGGRVWGFLSWIVVQYVIQKVSNIQTIWHKKKLGKKLPETEESGRWPNKDVNNSTWELWLKCLLQTSKDRSANPWNPSKARRCWHLRNVSIPTVRRKVETGESPDARGPANKRPCLRHGEDQYLPLYF